MIISDVNRTVNYSKMLSGHLEIWWDKSTGLMVKSNWWRNILGWYNLTMVSTTAWSPPPPTINNPSSITYTSGTTGHNITWVPSSLSPQSYTITRNGVIVASGSWDGHNIVYSIDSLAVGTYVYTCTVHDTSGYSASSSVIVTVTAPSSLFSDTWALVAMGEGVLIVLLIALMAMRGSRKKRSR
jgi:plastocyanin